ncbi:MAG TPA: DUF1570 domain-containing protein [Pirellulaceae bacterium]|nr:DUF1570 domain-containing protein [Pirellulaceae bacterium]
MISTRLLTLTVAAVTLLAATQALALDYITLMAGDQRRQLDGRIEVEAEDGGVLLLARDGALWPIPKEEIADRRQDDKPFVPLSRDELAKKVMAGLPAGFRVHSTKHYLICYNTSPAYAEWVGGLYERLFGAFYNYWQRRKVELKEPEFPLVALVFDSRSSYAAYARHELGGATGSIIGYYSLKSNQVNMYDLTGIEELKVSGDRSSSARINAILSQPAAERTVATIVHEATHQIAFNSGLQARFADIPFWVSEGIAIYFETPDLASSRGWRNIGGINRVNLFNFRKSLRDRPADALARLISDDKRFRDPKTASDAYAEAWALNYFLLRKFEKEYVQYVKELSQLSPLVEEGAEFRLMLFKKHFGEDLAKVEVEFLRYMRGVQ